MRLVTPIGTRTDIPLPDEPSSNRPPASAAMLPDYAALRYSLIIYYPPPQLIAHKNTPSLFLLLIKTSLVFSYCPRKSGPLLTFAHEFSFNYQEKLNNAPSAPIAPSPATPLPDEPQSTVHQRVKQRCIILLLPYPDAHLPGDGPIKLPTTPNLLPIRISHSFASWLAFLFPGIGRIGFSGGRGGAGD